MPCEDRNHRWVPKDMQRVLEGDLLIRASTIILRNGLLHGLEVEEIKRIAQLIEKLTDTLLIDIGLLIYLQQMDGLRDNIHHIGKRTITLLI